MPADKSPNLRGECDALTRVHETLTHLPVCPDLTAALDEVLVATMEITGAEMGNVQLLNARGDALEVVAQRGFRQDVLEHFREVSLDDEAAWGRAMREGVRIVVEDVQTDPRFEPYREIVAAAGCRAVQATPLLSRTGEVLGVLSTHYARPYRPGERERRVLDLCARQAADFIERRRAEDALFRSEQQRRAELADTMLLQKISEQLIEQEDVEALYEKILDAAVDITQTDRGTMQTLDAETGELCLLTAKGMPPQVWERFARVSPIAHTSCAEALRRGERVLVDYVTDARVAGTEDARAHLDAGIRSAQSTPLVTRSGRLVGMLTTHWREPHVPSERDLRLLDILARQAADLVERARTEQILRESEARLSATFAHAAVGLSEHSLDGRFLRVNAEMCRMLGRSRQWMLQASIPDVTHPDDRPASLEALGRLVDTGGPLSIDKRYVCADGKVVFANSALSRLDDAEGRPRSILAVTVDLTERKRAEEQLRRNHETFFNLIQNSPFGVYIVDSQFRLRQVSAGAQKVFQNVRPLIGRDFADVLRSIWEEPFASEAVARFRHTLETGEPYVALDATEQRHDIAEVESYDWRIERITLPDGQFGVVCHFYDLSDIKRAEAEIRRRVEEAEEGRRILQGIMDYVPEGITVADAPDVTIRMVSRHGIDLVGRPAETLLNEPDAVHPEAWGIFHPDDETPGKPEELPLTRAVREGEVVINEEWLLRRPDGSAVTILCNAGPIRNRDGAITGGIIAWRDIAELKRAEQVLKDADRRKNQFLATLGHELRNPLGAIRMALPMLQSTKGDPERFEKIAAVLDRQSLQLVRLIDDLLDVSRITHDKIGLRQQRLELAPVIGQALEAIRPLCESQNVDLSAVVPPRPIMVEADAVRLGQVIGNLLHNASKYTPPGGRVRLIVEQEGEQAVIRVQDTGEGIPPEHLPRLFEMFGQIDPLRDRGQGGLGIGLALSKRLVEMHGGTIEARSEGLGRGSEFIVRVPVAPSEADENDRHTSPEVVVRSPVASPTPTAPRRRILAVDGNPDALHTLTAHLRLNGHEVLEAEDGEQALHAAETHRPEVMLLDIGLPGMDGYEVARRIRERPWGKNVRIIAMTGEGHEEDKRRAAEAGFYTHLRKPADVEVIERVLG